MQQSNTSRQIEQTNVGETQVINNHFHAHPGTLSKLKSLRNILMIAGILMLGISPFTLAYLPFSVVLAASGLLLLPGVGGKVAGIFRIPRTPAMRNRALIALLLLNIPFAIAFGSEKSRLAEAYRSGLLYEQQAKRDEQQRKDSLDVCLQRIADFRHRGQIDNALMEVDKARLFAKSAGEKADVNQVRTEVSLIKVTLLMNRRQYNMAIDLLNDVCKLDTNNTEVLYQRALCYVKTRHLASAAHDAKRAMLLGHATSDSLYQKINPIRERYTYTTRCKDGSFSKAPGCGACSHHGGVATRKHQVLETYRQYE